MVRGTWARGHARRGEGAAMVTPLTAEEIESGGDEYEDLGTIVLQDPPQGIPPGGGNHAPQPSEPPPGPTGPDEPPAHARKRGRPPGSKNQAPSVPRVTAGVRADISAKVSMPLEIAGQIWHARDQLCGGVFLVQRPAIADSLTNIICQSADLVAFFTGPGGAFMRYLELGAALWPVVEVVAAHHVYHSVEAAPQDPQQPRQQPAYAA